MGALMEAAAPAPRAPFQGHWIHPNSLCTFVMNTYCLWPWSLTNPLACSCRQPAEAELCAARAGRRAGSKACPSGLHPCCLAAADLARSLPHHGSVPHPQAAPSLTLTGLWNSSFFICVSLRSCEADTEKEARGCASPGESCSSSPADGNVSLQQCSGGEAADTASPIWISE